MLREVLGTYPSRQARGESLSLLPFLILLGRARGSLKGEGPARSATSLDLAGLCPLAGWGWEPSWEEEPPACWGNPRPSGVVLVKNCLLMLGPLCPEDKQPTAVPFWHSLGGLEESRKVVALGLYTAPHFKGHPNLQACALTMRFVQLGH